jgi:hypothetical protein
MVLVHNDPKLNKNFIQLILLSNQSKDLQDLVYDKLTVELNLEYLKDIQLIFFDHFFK